MTVHFVVQSDCKLPALLMVVVMVVVVVVVVPEAEKEDDIPIYLRPYASLIQGG